MIIETHSADETIAFGSSFGASLKPGSVVCFFGDLAAGKTTLIKGIVSAVTGVTPDEVISPTFVLLNIYEGLCPVYHFDLYRLKGADEFLSMGFDEYFQGPGIACIEWSERIQDILPKSALQIILTTLGNDNRRIEIT